MKCETEDCTNEAIHHRRWCAKCRTRAYRKKYPLKYIYNTIKYNARRRGKQFDLTFDQFKTFCQKTGYDELKGKSALSLSIDRKDSTKGYTYENIRAITLSENSRKGNHSLESGEKCPF